MNPRFRSWLASVPAFLAVVAVFILGAAVVVAVFERMNTLSRQNQCVLFILAFYVLCFAIYEINARERGRRHSHMVAMRGHGWIKRFKDVTPNTDHNTLQALYEDGVLLRDEFGVHLPHPDFKRDMEVLADLLKPDQ